jgi:hypothetical protein
MMFAEGMSHDEESSIDDLIGNQLHRMELLPRSPFGGDTHMGRGLLLWLIGIPLPIILLIWIFGGLH